MIRPVLGAIVAIGLAACGQAPTGPGANESDTSAPAQSAATIGDPCALITDTNAIFGRDVAAAREPMPNMCRWSSPDAAITASIIVHGQGWSAVSDAEQAYRQMLEPMGELGAARPVAGLGDEAMALETGARTQIFFRKGAVAVNVGASSSDPALASTALAERIARAAADRL